MGAELFNHFIINEISTIDNPVTITMNKDITVVVNYITTMGTITINGSVSAQSTSGEIVTIVITKPDNTKVTLSTSTQPDKSFSKTYMDVPGNYNLIASIEPDAEFNGATSPPTPFTIAKEERTISVTVS